MNSVDSTMVHVIRHGQVYNPKGILYGRLPGFGLSDLGEQMASEIAQYFAKVEINHLRCSPLLRAQQTMQGIADTHSELEVITDERLTECGNLFEGHIFGSKNKALYDPRMFWHMRNPFRPSWGEPYKDIAARMLAAIKDSAKAAGEGGRAIIVSHQLPIWIARRKAEGRFLFHDPRYRQCSLVSVTTFLLRAGHITAVEYAEPVKHLLPKKRKHKYQVGY